MTSPIRLEESEAPVSAADLDALERRFGFAFPLSFRTQYLKFNGGYLPEERMERQRMAFGGFEPIRYSTLPAETLYLDLLEAFPQLEGLFPFAHDQGGSSFLIALGKRADLGRIYIWLMDGEELLPIADSFDEFVDLLWGE